MELETSLAICDEFPRNVREQRNDPVTATGQHMTSISDTIFIRRRCRHLKL
jgi:hypothetical protein